MPPMKPHILTLMLLLTLRLCCLLLLLLLVCHSRKLATSPIPSHSCCGCPNVADSIRNDATPSPLCWLARPVAACRRCSLASVLLLLSLLLSLALLLLLSLPIPRVGHLPRLVHPAGLLIFAELQPGIVRLLLLSLLKNVVGYSAVLVVICSRAWRKPSQPFRLTARAVCKWSTSPQATEGADKKQLPVICPASAKTARRQHPPSGSRRPFSRLSISQASGTMLMRRPQLCCRIALTFSDSASTRVVGTSRWVARDRTRPLWKSMTPVEGWACKAV